MAFNLSCVSTTYRKVNKGAVLTYLASNVSCLSTSRKEKRRGFDMMSVLFVSCPYLAFNLSCLLITMKERGGFHSFFMMSAPGIHAPLAFLGAWQRWRVERPMNSVWNR